MLELRRLEPGTVDAVTRLHCGSLDGLLARLGRRAVRAYYVGCMRSEIAVARVAVEAGEVRGVVLGSAHPDRLDAEVLTRNRLATLAGVGVGLLRRPSLARWLVAPRRGASEGGFDRRVAELRYLAVDPAHRGAGTGRRLVEAFSTEMERAGVAAFELSVDEDNQQAISFYRALGFEQIGRYREFGRGHIRFTLAL